MNKNLFKREQLNHFRLKRNFKTSRDVSKGFTLIELLFVAAIIIILASLGMFLYHKGLAYAKETVCETNLRTLNKAIKLYSSENNDALPASLGHLKLEHLEKAYAMVRKDNDWLSKLSLLLLKIDASDQAYAQFLTYENLKEFGISENIFHCPADKNGGASYGMNSDLEGKSWSEVDEEMIIVADSDSYFFYTKNQLAKRHSHKAIGITKLDRIVNVTNENVVLIDGEVVEDVGTIGTIGTIDEESDFVTICHKTGAGSGKTMTKKTITIRKSELHGHLGHGDTIGACDGN